MAAEASSRVFHGQVTQLRSGLCVFRDRWAGGTQGSDIRDVLASPVSLRQDVPMHCFVASRDSQRPLAVPMAAM